jgi:translation elongation factor EF-4
MLFASVYPMDGDCFETLLLAVERLALNDASLEVEKESSTTLGNGLRIGFLGMLHMQVRVTLDVCIGIFEVYEHCAIIGDETCMLVY